MSFDSKCYELAKEFLSENPEMDTESARNDLAQLIQDTIEIFMTEDFK